ncbi:MAG: YdcF family protein [Acetobacteraceae bacterium]|nr:YdcF family protein [Acetobacteraceae bacterium]
MAAIVIFGAAVRADGRPSTTLERRVDAAATFGAQLTDPIYIPTGGVGRHGPSEASVMAELLIRRGVPRPSVLLEETGIDTLSSVRAVRRLVRHAGIDASLYVATSSYHLPRCLLLLRLAGLTPRAVPPPPFAAATAFWQRWFWRARELPALPYDAALLLGLRLLGRL